MANMVTGCIPEGDDAPISWKLFCVACIPLAAAAFLFDRSQSEVTGGIENAAAWFQANPKTCIEACSFGNITVRRIGGEGSHVLVLSKGDHSVGSFVNGELHIRSDLNDADRYRLRSEISSVVLAN
jgi:hypothetical protein